MKKAPILLQIILLLLLPTILKAQQYNLDDAKLLDMYQNQHYAQAAEYLKQNCPEPITNIKILSRFAYTYQMAGKSNEAETYYKRMYHLDSASVPVLLSLAGINSARENKPKALLYYEKAAALDTGNFEVYKSLGRLYLENSDTSNAFKNLFKANTIDPDEPYVASDFSSILIATKKLKQAEAVLTRALAADSTNLVLLRQVVSMYYVASRFKETISICNKMLDLGDQSNNVVNKLGTSYYKLKNYECCIQSFALLQDAAQTEGSYYLVAMSYKGLKKYKQAIYYLNKSLEQAISPYTDSYYNELADTYDVLKQYKTEAAAYQKSLFFKSTNGAVYYSMANLYDKNLHDKKNALKYFKKYLDSKPPLKEQAYIAYVQSRVAELKK